ncbi:hypothetical protein BDZ90DRAFT_259879 [Jaminaea rosea]|uniref:Uncharacterized protein n=1 Tax=Jaminaea rosea TaxID=1569628 RepID=A0A316URY6_9BASI|nr:hypothetical protein BDZ90DRAFT_259879 [Jaminaea rosea]PWN28052.1 hypothetical protein BDZ90DRAFT_259879 [Jaminaea rosea]
METDDVDSLPPSSDSEVSTTSSSSSSSSHAAKKPSSSFKSRPPTGSLSLSIFSPNISFRRRMSLLASSLAVNACLPFVNGIMLGTGEIVARAVLVPTLLIGWSWIRQRGQKV